MFRSGRPIVRMVLDLRFWLVLRHDQNGLTSFGCRRWTSQLLIILRLSAAIEGVPIVGLFILCLLLAKLTSQNWGISLTHIIVGMMTRFWCNKSQHTFVRSHSAVIWGEGDRIDESWDTKKSTCFLVDRSSATFGHDRKWETMSRGDHRRALAALDPARSPSLCMASADDFLHGSDVRRCVEQLPLLRS